MNWHSGVAAADAQVSVPVSWVSPQAVELLVH